MPAPASCVKTLRRRALPPRLDSRLKVGREDFPHTQPTNPPCHARGLARPPARMVPSLRWWAGARAGRERGRQARSGAAGRTCASSLVGSAHKGEAKEREQPYGVGGRHAPLAPGMGRERFWWRQTPTPTTTQGKAERN